MRKAMVVTPSSLCQNWWVGGALRGCLPTFSCTASRPALAGLYLAFTCLHCAPKASGKDQGFFAQ